MGSSRNIYVASSWRNEIQPAVVKALRDAGHEVYDFKNPRPGDQGFHWSEIDPNWKGWQPGVFRQALLHPVAQAGFKSDFDAMKSADTFVLVLPCGRSAHLEMGWAAGRGKHTIMLLADHQEPELMYLMTDYLCLTIEEVVATVAQLNGLSVQLQERVTGKPWSPTGPWCPRCRDRLAGGSNSPGRTCGTCMTPCEVFVGQTDGWALISTDVVSQAREELNKARKDAELVRVQPVLNRIDRVLSMLPAEEVSGDGK